MSKELDRYIQEGWAKARTTACETHLEYPTQKTLGWTAGTYRYFALQSKDD